MNLTAALHRLAAEQDCYLCGCASVQAVCMECVAAFPSAPAPACPCCALPVPHAGLNGPRGSCGRCLVNPPHFDATVAAFAYGDPLDKALQAFKYRHALGLTRFLAAQLDRTLGVLARASLVAGSASPGVDLIVPMPLARARLAQRGFNQALELARPLAQRRRIPLDAHAVRRIRDTPPQAQLPWKERARNIQGAFAYAAGVTGAVTGTVTGAAGTALTGLRVAVVDDVMTTGSTLNELARVLKANGAAHVSNWVIARTLPHSVTHPAAPASA